MEKKNYIYETANKVDYDLLKQYADENKLFMTDAEIALWNLLKGNGIGDKFRRQHIVGEYIADFINLKYKLIVEVDGKYHFKGDQPVADEQRTADLNRMGYTVVRFTNDEVIGDIRKVGYQIRDIIKQMKVSYPSNNKPSTSNNTVSRGCAQGSSPLPLEGEGRGVTPSLALLGLLPLTVTLGLLMQLARVILVLWSIRLSTSLRVLRYFISVRFMARTISGNSSLLFML